MFSLSGYFVKIVKKDIGLLYNMEYNRPLFNEPIVDQVGSHMIMSNVVRPLKKKYCNIEEATPAQLSPL